MHAQSLEESDIDDLTKNFLLHFFETARRPRGGAGFSILYTIGSWEVNPMVQCISLWSPHHSENDTRSAGHW